MEFLAWPAVVLILGVFALLLFKKPFSRLIDRTEKISKEGVQARGAQEQPSDLAISRVDEFLNIYDNQLLLETEKLIKDSLDNLKPQTPQERERFLLRNLAAVALTESFVKTYFTIWGSQIVTLHYMTDNRNSSLTIEHVRHFYEDAKNKYPSYYQNNNFERWLNFLVSSALVQRNGNDIGITVRGKEFLKFLLDQGYSYLKPG